VPLFLACLVHGLRYGQFFVWTNFLPEPEVLQNNFHLAAKNNSLALVTAAIS